MGEHKEILLGNNPLRPDNDKVQGNIVTIEGEEYYKISDYLAMPPFFITVVSDSDHWMYVSSHGGLTCGRRNPDSVLFPYTTDDKIHDASHTTGPQTIILVEKENKTFIWEPFEQKHKGIYKVEQNIYKSITGNKLIFEEINIDLKTSFSYCWMNSDKFGFVRESQLINLDKASNAYYKVLDGLRNIMPYGVNRGLQNTMSTLVDGYKKCEVDEKTGLGIFTLSAIMTDKAEPSEALKATTVFHSGLPEPEILLSADQFDKFIFGEKISTEKTLKGRRGSYFINARINLGSGSKKGWTIVAELNQGPSEVARLMHQMESGSLSEKIRQDIESGTENLRYKVAAADGFQFTADLSGISRHYSNTLFNIMRGGIFSNGYLIVKADLLVFIKQWNAHFFEKYESILSALPDQALLPDLLEKVSEINDPDFERFILEYLPLTFGRRHGDPSRPWNVFSIDIKNPDGSENIYYQGNWRDIFQNWQALALSYPGFIESFIVKFVNASTADGYNPYRITNKGFEWEVPDPDDPWSNIGYWGDHQIIYLLNLLELSAKYHPGLLEEFLHKKIFVYANVPYKIKPYNELLNDPRNSVLYDSELEKNIHARVKEIGSDGKLCVGQDGSVYHVNLTEKILVSLLAKIYNFVPGGGIWMSTQRPEWNDANNALVGYGLSMVTLFNLYKNLNFLLSLFESSKEKNISVSVEVAELLKSMVHIFEAQSYLLRGKISDSHRKEFADLLGKAGEKYRWTIYKGFSGKTVTIEVEKLCDFLKLCQLYFYQTIKLNKRSDGLYHSYNLIHFKAEGYEVEHLYEMLEGQVTLLGSGFLSPEEGAELLDALRQSNLYRADQKSYMLYPDRQLPTFIEKNIIAWEKLSSSPFLLKELKCKKDKYIEVDINGFHHFNGNFRNAAELRVALQKELSIDKNETDRICTIYYELFNHSQFTGRSGTFYKYEGLGCIYWHMVSKLQLAVQELWFEALKRNTRKQVLDKISSYYHQIKEGLGAGKSPAEYGAFPIDPYSHTPGFAGVQQPGMTGQVKEDFISRFGELGVIVLNGEISFKPSLLSKDEFLKQPVQWNYYRGKDKMSLPLENGTLAFMLCGIPVVYCLAVKEGVAVELSDGSKRIFDANTLDKDTSIKVFERSSEISNIIVKINLS